MITIQVRGRQLYIGRGAAPGPGEECRVDKKKNGDALTNTEYAVDASNCPYSNPRRGVPGKGPAGVWTPQGRNMANMIRSVVEEVLGSPVCKSVCSASWSQSQVQDSSKFWVRESERERRGVITLWIAKHAILYHSLSLAISLSISLYHFLIPSPFPSYANCPFHLPDYHRLSVHKTIRRLQPWTQLEGAQYRA